MDVLRVEDEPLVREAVAEALDAAGLDVAQAGSAEGALAVVGLAAVGLAAVGPAFTAAGPQGPPATTAIPAPPPPAPAPPAVLVTDVNLGSAPDGARLDGFALAAALRHRWPGLGVVVMTGSAANLTRCAALGPPERHFLKPFAPEDLAQAVRDLATPPASASER
jgi:CheY-like chemotaxis protein